MKRLIKSSGFWIFIIASVVLTTVWMLTEEMTLVSLLAGLVGLDRMGKVYEDGVKAVKGVEYNEETQRNQFIK